LKEVLLAGIVNIIPYAIYPFENEFIIFI